MYGWKNYFWAVEEKLKNRFLSKYFFYFGKHFKRKSWRRMFFLQIGQVLSQVQWERLEMRQLGTDWLRKARLIYLDDILIWSYLNWRKWKENIYENLKNLSTFQQWKIQSYLVAIVRRWNKKWFVFQVSDHSVGK